MNVATNSQQPSNSPYLPHLLSSPVLSRKEAARYLGVAAQTLAQWACTGRVALPLVKIGARKVGYLISDLDAFIASNKKAYHA